MRVCVEQLTLEPRPFPTSAGRKGDNTRTHTHGKDERAHVCACLCLCKSLCACVYVSCVYMCKHTGLHKHTHTHTNVVPGTHSLFVDVRDRDFQDTEETYDSVLQWQNSLLERTLC